VGAGGARSRAISDRVSANICRETATSAIWNVTYRPWLTTFALQKVVVCERPEWGSNGGAGQLPQLPQLPQLRLQGAEINRFVMNSMAPYSPAHPRAFQCERRR
jgi:hypothetical protein